MIKVGFCVAYDWYYLATSLPLVYSFSDKICLSIDRDRTSWAGKKFDFDEDAFKKFLLNIDVEKKITVYEDNFHLSDLTPMENEVRQRNLMAENLGKDDSWHIQLDTDEYFLDFEKFIKYLKSLNIKRAVNICCPFYILFKSLDQSFLFIKNNDPAKVEFIPIATNKPLYQYGRRNGYFNMHTEFNVIHQSWARSEVEILQKISNWGHKTDFDVKAFYRYWQKLDSANYKSYKNFHPMKGDIWESLEKVNAVDIKQLIGVLQKKPVLKFSKFYFMKENSVFLSRFKSLWNKIVK